jgi:hypothetical protein
MRRPPLTMLGAAGAAVGCAAMAGTLPAAVAAVLGTVGVSETSILARSLGSAAQPLFVASALLLTAGALGCSRLVAVLTAGGAILLYLSMFELAHGGSGSMAMTAMQHGAARADASTFYAGLALLLLSITLQIIRRHRGSCRPVLRLGHSG